MNGCMKVGRRGGEKGGRKGQKGGWREEMKDEMRCGEEIRRRFRVIQAGRNQSNLAHEMRYEKSISPYQCDPTLLRVNTKSCHSAIFINPLI